MNIKFTLIQIKHRLLTFYMNNKSNILFIYHLLLNFQSSRYKIKLQQHISMPSQLLLSFTRLIFYFYFLNFLLPDYNSIGIYLLPVFNCQGFVYIFLYIWQQHEVRSLDQIFRTSTKSSYQSVYFKYTAHAIGR